MARKYENLCKKYGIPFEEIVEAILQISLANIKCSTEVLYAVADLLLYGDIKDMSGGEQR